MKTTLDQSTEVGWRMWWKRKLWQTIDNEGVGGKKEDEIWKGFTSKFARFSI